MCSLGWELWFTYGWIDGDPVDSRRSEVLNDWLPKNINWLLNSMADAGTVLIGGVWLMWISHKKNSKVFTQWNWSAFCILMIWCIGQNVLVEMFLYHGLRYLLMDHTLILCYLSLIVELSCSKLRFRG